MIMSQTHVPMTVHPDWYIAVKDLRSTMRIIQIWLFTMRHLYITARTYVCQYMYVWLSIDHVWLWLDTQFEYRIEQILTDRNISFYSYINLKYDMALGLWCRNSWNQPNL